MPAKNPKRTVHLRPRYYRWFVEPGVEWVETNTGLCHAGLADADRSIGSGADRCLGMSLPPGHQCPVGTNHSAKEKIRPLLTACRQHGLQLIRALLPM